jgi:hypothetical protein
MTQTILNRDRSKHAPHSRQLFILNGGQRRDLLSWMAMGMVLCAFLLGRNRMNFGRFTLRFRIFLISANLPRPR